MLEIVNYPHPALRYASRPVTEIDDGLRATVRAMFELMYAAKGIGLAANQVALPFRFFVLNLTCRSRTDRQGASLHQSRDRQTALFGRG